MNTNMNGIEISAPGRGKYVFASMCLMIILLSMTLNDLPVQAFLGMLGASPMWAASAVIFILFLIQNKFRLYLDKYSRLLCSIFC
jgi:hypothetical protein